jgi:hypothetical protein
MSVRKVALLAALAQILFCLYATWPEIFGNHRAPILPTNFDWVSQTVFVIGCLSLAIFLTVVHHIGPSLNLSHWMRVTALVAASALAIENLLPTYGTIRGIVFASRYVLSWKHRHSFSELSYVFTPAIPTIAVVTLIAFFVAVYRVTPPSDCDDRKRPVLQVASLSAAVAGILSLGRVIYFHVLYMGSWCSTAVLALGGIKRMATILSLIAFFLATYAAHGGFRLRHAGVPQHLAS